MKKYEKNDGARVAPSSGNATSGYLSVSRDNSDSSPSLLSRLAEGDTISPLSAEINGHNWLHFSQTSFHCENWQRGRTTK